MGFAEVIAFFKALPALVEMLSGLRQDVKDLRRESMERELADYKAKVSADLTKIIGAKTNEERLRLANSLSQHLSL